MATITARVWIKPRDGQLVKVGDKIAARWVRSSMPSEIYDVAESEDIKVSNGTVIECATTGLVRVEAKFRAARVPAQHLLDCFANA